MQTVNALVGRTKRRRPKEGHVERVASAIVGGTLLTLGLRRRSLGGAAVALASGALLYRGIRARGQLLQGRGEQREAGARAEPPSVERTITIQKPAEELSRLWREPQNLSRIMGHFAEITPAGEDRMHWKVRAPIGRTVEWDARIVEDRPGELLRWESLEGAMLPTQGAVRFRPAPGDWGTEVALHLDFKPPGGALGQAVVKRMGRVPVKLVDKALRRFKSLAETGEIPTVENNPSARRAAHAD